MNQMTNQNSAALIGLDLGIKLSVGMVQKSVLLGTARILRKVLDM